MSHSLLHSPYIVQTSSLCTPLLQVANCRKLLWHHKDKHFRNRRKTWSPCLKQCNVSNQSGATIIILLHTFFMTLHLPIVSTSLIVVGCKVKAVVVLVLTLPSVRADSVKMFNLDNSRGNVLGWFKFYQRPNLFWFGKLFIWIELRIYHTTIQACLAAIVFYDTSSNTTKTFYRHLAYIFQFLELIIYVIALDW